MDIYDVTVKANVYILANSADDAEAMVKKELEGIDSFLPARTTDFSFAAYRTPCQEEWLKKRAINHDV